MIYRWKQRFQEITSQWFSSGTLEWVLGAVIVLLLSPAFVGNLMYPNADLAEHYRMLAQFSMALDEGVWQPRWSPLPRGGLGEPMPVYYPPLIYYVGGPMVLAGLSVWTALKLVVAAGLGAGALAMRRLCGLWTGRGAAALAACLLVLCPMVLLLEFTTANLPWMAGLCWGILLLTRCLEWSLPERGWRDGQWVDPWFAVLLALLTMTHILSALLVLATAPVAALASRNWMAAWRRFIVSSVAGLALAGFYFVPAVTTMHMINPNRWTGVEAYRAHFTFPLFYALAGKGVEWPTVQVQLTGLFAVTLVMAAVWMWRRRGEAESDRGWRPMAALLGAGLVALLLSTELTLPVWRLVRPLQFLQFPWRFLYIVIIVFCAVVGYAVSRGARWAPWIAGVSLLLGCSYLGKMYTSHVRTEYTSAILTGVFGLPEYRTAVPGNADGYLARGGLGGECAAAGATCVELDRRTLYRRWRVTAGKGFELRLPVYAYPAWGVRRGGAEMAVSPDAETGLVPVRVEAGVQEVELYWRGLEAERRGRMLSVAGLVLVAAGVIGRRRRV